MAPVASGMAFGSPLAIRSRKRLWHSAKPGMGSAPHACRDFAGRLTGWVWVPNSASRNATSSFEPTWIMMISFSLGWSGTAGGAFETIGFQHCFRRVSSRRATWSSEIGTAVRAKGYRCVGPDARPATPHGLSSAPGLGPFLPPRNSTRARLVLVTPGLLPGQLVAAGTPEDGNRPLG